MSYIILNKYYLQYFINSVNDNSTSLFFFENLIFAAAFSYKPYFSISSALGISPAKRKTRKSKQIKVGLEHLGIEKIEAVSR